MTYRVLYPFDESRGFWLSVLMSADVTVGIPLSKNPVPSCVQNPALCETFIEEQKAVQIAAEEGLPVGLAEWRTKFSWGSTNGRFIWTVESLVYKSEAEDRHSIIQLDAGSGDVIRRDVISSMQNIQMLDAVRPK